MLARSPALNFPQGRTDVGELTPIGVDGFKGLAGEHQAELTMSSGGYYSVSSSPDQTVEDSGGDGDAHVRTPSATNSVLGQVSQQGAEGTKREVIPSFEQKVGEEPAHRETQSFLGDVDTPGPLPIHQWVLGAQAPANHEILDFPSNLLGSDRRDTPPTAPQRSLSYNLPFKTTSPVSSISSVSAASARASSVEFSGLTFEAQLQSSATFRELMNRLARCEQSNREIQRELSDIHGKVSLLVERTLGSMSAEPVFKDPFAHTPPGVRHGSMTPSNAITPLHMAHGQGNPSVKADDIYHLNSRINTLTSSVGQLLAFQTQQHVNSATQALIQPLGHVPPSVNLEIAPNQIISPPVNHAALLGHGLPHRPELRPSPRNPNPPIRTWSAGTLDLPLRPIDGLPLPGRTDGVIRDKRRSVAGLMRRDSSGLGFGSVTPDIQGEQWGANSPRDNGPVATKWEHLPLATELLRSLNKFGVGPPNKIQQRALPFLLRGSDIIAQAPPTQERIAAYVIPAIHVAVSQMAARPIHRGPVVVMISTTVDQATQAQRMIRDIGGPIGIRSALGVGTAGSTNDIAHELNLLQQNLPHIICGTPQKLHALFTTPGGLIGSEVRFLVLDEVDQLIARNLHEFVFSIVKLLPPPRTRSAGTPNTSPSSAGTNQAPFNPLDPNGAGLGSPFQNNGRRFSAMSISSSSVSTGSITPPPVSQVERQTALFSNTVPQDVLNLANAIQLREPVRVLVRRDGNIAQTESGQGTKGLRQFYLYLAFTPGSRPDVASSGPGTGHGIIGSGRGASNAETAQAREWKLDALADLLDDVEVSQIIVHVGGVLALDSVLYKLASKGLEAVPLHSDMNAGAKLAALNKFRASSGSMIRPAVTRVLVIYGVQVKTPDVSQVPLVINYDLPQAVEEYSHRVAPAIATNYSRAGVVVNFVTAAGGDVEMLRSIECFYKIKCPEVPMSLRDLL